MDVVLATAATVVAACPVFLVSAQAVEISRDLRLTVADLGAVVAVFFATTAVSTAMLGRAVQRLGVRRGLFGTMAVTTLGLGCIAVSRSSLQLGGALVVAGLANGAVHPTANGLLAESAGARPARAFGVKQAAPTAASLLSGLSVPVVALTVGWRWSFAAVCVASTTVALLGRPSVVPPARGRPPATHHRVTVRDARAPIGLIALAGAFGAAAGNALSAFFVVFGVHAEHVPQPTTALVFSLASLSGIVGRVSVGRFLDHVRVPATLLAGFLVCFGALGDLLLASGLLRGPAALLLGGVVAFGLGWSWPGLLHYCVAVRDPRRAPRATGVLMTGVATGACLGPLLLGQLVGTLGFPDVLRVAAALNVCAGLTLLLGTGVRFSHPQVTALPDCRGGHRARQGPSADPPRRFRTGSGPSGRRSA